ncbi:MAG: hypothetical protein IPK50_03130 [Fibrobacterota bacterium]|nr:MAG: hypothetical protein IPK50_03130 [Fibrobacterota bacterium]
MQHRTLAKTLAIFAGAACVGGFSAHAATVAVDPSIKHQQFEGWGTSLCWWAVLAGKWSEANRNRLIDAIVDPDTGLGYNCFRYNIGGGDRSDHTHLAEGRAVPGFKRTETGAYDWTADPYQRNILLGIAARGKDPIFEAFSNSPPWWMTISGCVSGNTNGADNLKADKFGAFAEYLADVAKHYKDVHKITFRTIEPFNEPSAGWWKPEGGQEGCGFKSNQAKMVKELGRQLVSKGLSPQTQVSAGDETSLEQAVTQLKGYDDSAFSYMSQINAHTYSGWTARSRLDSLAKARRKLLWQSETGPLNKGTDATDITMWMSNVILQDLRKMKPNAWLDWQVGDPVGDWITIKLDHAKQTFTYAPRFYMHAAFSRFIRPGSRIIESSDTNSVAALTPAGDLVVVFCNPDAAAASVTIDLSKFAALPATARMHRFSLPASLKRQADVVIDAKKITFSSPGQTLTTIVVPVGISAISPAPPSLAPSATMLQGGVLRIASTSTGPLDVTVFDPRGQILLAKRMESPGSTIDLDLGAARTSRGVVGVRLRQQGQEWSGRAVVVGQ